jgi:hypothetical protein
MKNMLIAITLGALLSGAVASQMPARSVAFDVPPPAAPLTDEADDSTLHNRIACENGCSRPAYTRS